ncbi:MAG TPA: hypothetical protein VLT32_08975 [Candidatus Sulfomarinibacteraceae bacterium]|nr:hypothetical protein [Candidatus Sulfomarinibacteraceae bacterium]
MRHVRLSVSIVFACVLTAASVTASDAGPQGVSPGAPDRFVPAGSACPTFSWESVPGNAVYELVVHRVDPHARAGGALDLSTDSEVLYTTVSGRATSWTVPATDCFGSGDSYVWFIRAVSDAETGEGSAWSEPRFFEVAAAPSAEQVRQALDVLSRYVAEGGDEAVLAALAEDDAAEPAREATARSGTARPAAAAPLKSRQGLVTAIQGEVTDPTGLAFGVLGASSSPDGGGVAAVNSAGGPDLVLDGWADGLSDTYLYQDRIEVASAGPRTFGFANTGGGTMTLDVAGPVTATRVDTTNTITAGGDLISLDDVKIGLDEGGDSDSIVFNTEAAPKYLRWSAGNAQFEVTDDLDVGGDLSAGSIEAQGALRVPLLWFVASPAMVKDAGNDTRISIYQDGPIEFTTPTGNAALGIAQDGTLSIPATLRWKTYSGACFVPGDSDNNYRVNYSDASLQTTDYIGESDHVAYVDLPHGAVVTRITAKFFDPSPYFEAELRLKRFSLSDGGVTQMSYLATEGDTGWQTPTDTTIAASTINNQDYHYFFYLDIPEGGVPPLPPGSPFQITFFWVQIEYETTLLAQ